jgi:hypothetical protein
MSYLNRFEKAIGIRTRPSIGIGDVVLLSRALPERVRKELGKRSKWLVVRRARTSQKKHPADGLCYFWIRNMKTGREMMMARRDLWKTGWNVTKK